MAILQSVCQYTGLTAAQSQIMCQRLQQDFYLVNPQQNIAWLQQAGFAQVKSFLADVAVSRIDGISKSDRVKAYV